MPFCNYVKLNQCVIMHFALSVGFLFFDTVLFDTLFTVHVTDSITIAACAESSYLDTFFSLTLSVRC